MAKKKKTKKVYQTGTRKSLAIDKMIKAKKPGKRKTSHGTTYIERRKNRSDMPNSMAGININLQSLDEHLKNLTLFQVKHFMRKTLDNKTIPLAKRKWRITNAVNKNGKFYIIGQSVDMIKYPMNFSLEFNTYDELQKFITGKIVKDHLTNRPIAKLIRRKKY